MLSTAASVAVLIIILHSILFIVLALVVGGASLKAMMLLNGKLRTSMPLVQGYARQLSRSADDVSQRVASPVVSLHAKQAGASAMRSRALRPLSRLASRTGLIDDSTPEK